MLAMRTINWLPGMLVIGLLAVAGCGKSNTTPAQAIPATLDLTKFRQAFPSPTPEQQANIAKVSAGVRYRLYPDALAALQKLAADPGLSGPQQQAVSEMVAGVQGAMTNATAPPAQ